MPGIARDTIETFRRKVDSFSSSYVEDWNAFIGTHPSARPAELGRVLRRWQACRPNTMRRHAASALHQAPYLDDLISAAAPHVEALSTFDIANSASFETAAFTTALAHLWDVFEQLSYQGRVRNGLAGSVGISKAVMLVTSGQVGPAFDSEVRGALKVGKINNFAQWHNALVVVNADIQAFQQANGISFSEAKPPRFAKLNNGRVYDMALGPR